MEKQITPGINLAKNRGEHLSDRILAFSLTIGRLLIIITEAVALGAFLFRFGLDRQLLDLHDRIGQEEAIIKLLQKNEATYRNLQDRLNLEKIIDMNSQESQKIFQDVSNMIPSDMAITLFDYSPAALHIEGSASSATTISTFVKKLQSYDAVDSVSLDKLENKTTTGSISVTLTVTLKKTVAKPLL